MRKWVYAFGVWLVSVFYFFFHFFIIVESEIPSSNFLVFLSVASVPIGFTSFLLFFGYLMTETKSAVGKFFGGMFAASSVICFFATMILLLQVEDSSVETQIVVAATDSIHVTGTATRKNLELISENPVSAPVPRPVQVVQEENQKKEDIYDDSDWEELEDMWDELEREREKREKELKRQREEMKEALKEQRIAAERRKAESEAKEKERKIQQCIRDRDECVAQASVNASVFGSSSASASASKAYIDECSRRYKCSEI